MKKRSLSLYTTLLILVLFSCTPSSDENKTTTQGPNSPEEFKIKTPHSILIINPCKSQDKVSMVLPVKKIIEEEIDSTITVLHYLKLKETDLTQFNAIVITGQSSPWQEYNLNNFAALKRTLLLGKTPTLGICGGHQLIALLFGGSVGLIKPESCDISKGYKGCFKVKGWVDVFVKNEMPLFQGYTTTTSFYASHCEEIKDLPIFFTTIASTPFSQHYGFVHNDFHIYGIQFHPELPANNNTQGRRVLVNFFKEAGFLSRQKIKL